MQLLNKTNQKRLKSYNHSNAQRGWTDQGPNPGQVKPWLTDEVLKEVNRIATPIREYILDRYVQVALDPLNPMNRSKIERVGRFVFLGRESVPVAIDISQWGYEVHVFVSNQKDFVEAYHDAKMQAGLFKTLNKTDYQNGDFLDCTAVVVVGLPEFLEYRSEVLRYLNNLFKRSHLLLCLFSIEEWRKYLGEGLELKNNGYKYELLAEPNQYVCLSIEQP